mgnify:CR=1 FL=1
MTTLNDAREQLLLLIEGAANFRAVNSHKHPDDKRNQASTLALSELHRYVSALPDNHPVFDICYNMDELATEDLNQRLSRYGFYGQENHEDFIQIELTLKTFKTN